MKRNVIMHTDGEQNENRPGEQCDHTEVELEKRHEDKCDHTDGEQNENRPGEQCDHTKVELKDENRPEEQCDPTNSLILVEQEKISEKIIMKGVVLGLATKRQEIIQKPIVLDVTDHYSDTIGSNRLCKLNPDLDSILHLLAICAVHYATEVKLSGSEIKWYENFQVQPFAGEDTNIAVFLYEIMFQSSWTYAQVPHHQSDGSSSTVMRPASNAPAQNTFA
ncbi:hypothetical protein ACFE04_030592 [Oxalis oulophora]